MGNFYTNFTLRGPSPQSVAKALQGRSAFVTPSQNGCVVVYEEASDDQDLDAIMALASHLSGELNCPVLAVLNHDDDVFWYFLYDGGEPVDQYDSTPGYFEDRYEDSVPEGGDAVLLCRTFGAEAVPAVEDVLRAPSTAEGGYLFAVARHADLARLLGIPDYGVGMGYEGISNGMAPEGLTRERLIRVE